MQFYNIFVCIFQQLFSPIYRKSCLLKDVTLDYLGLFVLERVQDTVSSPPKMTKLVRLILSVSCAYPSKILFLDGDPMCLVGRLFTSNLVTLVSLNDMRKLLIFHYRRNSLICDYRYTNTILAVKMNRQVGLHNFI